MRNRALSKVYSYFLVLKILSRRFIYLFKLNWFSLFPGPFDVPIRCQWIIDASNAISANTSIIVYLTQLFTYEGEFTKGFELEILFQHHPLLVYLSPMIHCHSLYSFQEKTSIINISFRTNRTLSYQ